MVSTLCIWHMRKLNHCGIHQHHGQLFIVFALMMSNCYLMSVHSWCQNGITWSMCACDVHCKRSWLWSLKCPPAARPPEVLLKLEQRSVIESVCQDSMWLATVGSWSRYPTRCFCLFWLRQAWVMKLWEKFFSTKCVILFSVPMNYNMSIFSNNYIFSGWIRMVLVILCDLKLLQQF